MSQIRNTADKFILQELSQNGIEGLAPSHGEIMAQLFIAEELTMKELAEKIHRSKPTVTVLVDKLSTYDYVSKTKCPRDSRITFIRLTTKGQALRPLFQNVSHKLILRIYAGMSSAEAVNLESALIKIKRNLERDRD